MKPSEQLAEVYHLELDASWQAWFDHDTKGLLLPGMMRQCTSAEELCAPAPSMVWPGFMLPDTLPILGNEYGDWICVRVTAENTLGELLYWYHGGGDWIPVGSTLAEAILHDVVDQFRPVRKQMLRGAAESRVDTLGTVLMRADEQRFRGWLSAQLPRSNDSSGSLPEIFSHLASEDYAQALTVMRSANWSPAAVSCDLLDCCLQQPVQGIAKRELSEAAEAPWFPDYSRILFDAELAETHQRRAVLQALGSRTDWPTQDWATASKVAGEVLRQRQDLGWAGAIVGWNLERQGEIRSAVKVYWDSLLASSFTEQGVRFNTHSDADEWTKFSIARLVANTEQLTGLLGSNCVRARYVQLFLRPQKRSLLQEVSSFWMHQAKEDEQAGDSEAAYENFFRSGWDMGVSRLSEYQNILASLARCSSTSGWIARAKVAQVHLDCLQQRTGG